MNGMVKESLLYAGIACGKSVVPPTKDQVVGRRFDVAQFVRPFMPYRPAWICTIVRSADMLSGFFGSLARVLIYACLIAIPAMVETSPAEAQPDSVRRGAEHVEQWCRLCHLRKDDAPRPGMGPPFEKIVRRSGRNEAFFRSFMKNDHFPMTTFRLFDHEKADVVAYLVFLQQAGK